MATWQNCGRASRVSSVGVGVHVASLRTVAVWDLPTRLFKWSLVIAVFVGFLFSSSHPRGSLFVVHVGCGYAVTLLLLFRLVWGFIGGEYARFRSFVRGWSSVWLYARGLVRLDPPGTRGHNPVGGWMIMTMLVTLVAIVVTGLLVEGRTGGAGRLSGLLPSGAVAGVGGIHAWLGFLIMWLAGVHVLGVLLESVLHRENLIRTMISGRKQTEDPNCIDARRAPAWRVVPLVVVLMLLGAWLASGTRVPLSYPTTAVHGR